MRKTLFALLLGASFALGARHHEDIERDYHPRYLERATGTKHVSRERYHWPVSVLSIGHTIASYQLYSPSLSSAYFHHGLDIRADASSEVIASVGGKVINIENYEPGQAAYWEIAILDDEGFIWQYHHIDSKTIPQAVKDAFANGTKIATGQRLGGVFYWPIIANGERYNHIHLNVLGAGKKYLTPFDFLENLADKKFPEVVEIGVLKGGKKWTKGKVTPPYSLYAHVRDLILHDKFYVPPHQIQFTIDDGMPVLYWRFDELPGGASNEKFVNQMYATSLASLTCGNYECRRPIFDLGFSPNGAFKFPTSAGEHRLLLTVKDYEGNSSSKEYVWNVE